MSSEWRSALVALAVSSAAILLIYGAFRAVIAIKRRSSSPGAVGWAMLFLTSGRMPPPPPASQIERRPTTRKGRAHRLTLDANSMSNRERLPASRFQPIGGVAIDSSLLL